MQTIATTTLERRTVFDMLPMPAYIKNVDLVYTHANDALCTLLGTSVDEIVGRTAADLNPTDWSWHEDTDRRLLASGGVASYELNLHPPGREPIRGELFKIRLDDADSVPVGLLGVVIDRTQQFNAEQHLVESQTLHRLVVESISDAVMLLDGAGRFTFVAPNIGAIFGIGVDEAMARGGLAELVSCEGCPLHDLPRDRESVNVECFAILADGSRRELLLSAKPIEIGASRWLVTCRDVTERVEAANRLKSSMIKTVQALCATVERRDPYVVGHQDRVADLALAIGRRMGLDENRLEGLRLASIVHDIGKVNVPTEILNKPGRLSAPEFAIIKTHPEVGYEILKDIDFPWPVARMVREHHETMDGSGYPLGLTGDQLLLESRILSVADVLEAVTSHRPYRPGLGLDKGLEVLAEMRGTKLDPAVVDVCLDLIRNREVTVPGWTSAEPAELLRA